MAPRPFADDQIAAIRAIASVCRYRAGDIILEAAASQDRFVLVEGGEIEVADPVTGKRVHDATLRPGQFMGELAFLQGRADDPVDAGFGGHQHHRGSALGHAPADERCPRDRRPHPHRLCCAPEAHLRIG
ncbi:cyclic nucleotide-binding domain-containing protein [Sphingomonas sp. LHG3443-2]|uniref:cyclic nucleotide-binding domain-containing protein n=1 Tax=Sphingomonas sp. LHG3443-2 TaxID=2804639 RepID=UPI003CF74698